MQQYKRWVIYTASLFLIISAVLINGTNMYFMAALLLMLPLVSYAVGMHSLRDLEFSREAPASGWDGETVTFQLVVRSKSRVPRLVLEARDELPEWLHPESRGPIVFHAAPNSTTRTAYGVRLEKRGAYRLTGFVVTALDPLGIYSFAKRFPVEGDILVYPVPEAMPELILGGAERYGFRELPMAAVRGSGVDPDGVREYIPGDPLRRMHWKSTARTGTLNVIEFEESRAANIVLALNTHRGAHVGTGKQSTFEYLVRAAASMAQSAVRQGASVRLVATEGPDPADSSRRGTDHLYTMLSSLARVEPEDEEPLSQTLIRRVGSLPTGNSLVVFTSGHDADLPGVLRHYTMTGIQVVVIHADSRSFVPESRHPTQEEQREYLDMLHAAQTATYLISRNESGSLIPETANDVGFTSSRRGG